MMPTGPKMNPEVGLQVAKMAKHEVARNYLVDHPTQSVGSIPSFWIKPTYPTEITGDFSHTDDPPGTQDLLKESTVSARKHV